jgi:hypothetical protein
MKLKVINPINESAATEYVLWGVPPGKSEEAILMTSFDGKTITDPKVAENLKKVLSDKHKCTKVRIQTVNMSDGKIDMSGTVNESVGTTKHTLGADFVTKWVSGAGGGVIILDRTNSTIIMPFELDKVGMNSIAAGTDFNEAKVRVLKCSSAQNAEAIYNGVNSGRAAWATANNFKTVGEERTLQSFQ